MNFIIGIILGLYVGMAVAISLAHKLTPMPSQLITGWRALLTPYYLVKAYLATR